MCFHRLAHKASIWVPAMSKRWSRLSKAILSTRAQIGWYRAYDRARRPDILTRTGSVDALNRSLLSGMLPAQIVRGWDWKCSAHSHPLRCSSCVRGFVWQRFLTHLLPKTNHTSDGKRSINRFGPSETSNRQNCRFRRHNLSRGELHSVIGMTQIKHAKFQIGQVVKHRLFPFHGVIFDVDPEFANTEEWYESIPEEARRIMTSRFTICSRKTPRIEYVAYVSEQNLVPDLSGEPLRHPPDRGDV